MTEVYIQYDDQEVSLDHDYNIEKENNVTYIKYSNNSNWNRSDRGEICGSLIDNGNGISIQLKFMESLELDYAQAQQLLALLLDDADYRMQLRVSKIIKAI